MTLPLEATAEEHALAGRVLAVTNCEATGVLGPEAAIAVFQRSGLSFELLRDIWNVADKNGSGDLSRDELVVAIRLMGWMQQGEVALSQDLVEKAGPLVKLEGITNLLAREPSPSFTIKTPMFPVVSMAEIRNYGSLFQRMGPSNGLLEGEKVTEAFMSSNLPHQDIWRVKQLVDTTERGALNFRQFALGMFLIQALQSCLISEVPSSVPADLHDQFKDLQEPSPSPPPPAAIDLRHRASLSLPAPSLRSYASTPMLQHSISHLSDGVGQDGISWGISPEEKKNAESLFEKLDFERKGYLEMQTAAKFMLTYRLPQEDLGRIWILSDVNRDKKLTLDEFTIVMHLIQQRLQGAPIPDKLPASLALPPFTPSPIPSPNISPTQKAKPPPPPPKKAGLSLSPTMLARSRSSISSPTNPMSTAPLSPPLSPMTRRPSAITPASASFLTNVKRPPRPPTPEPVQSPFEDPNAELHIPFGSSRQPSPGPAPLTPSPRAAESSRVEALEEMFRKETARLSKQVDMLLAQLTEQNTLRQANEALTAANATLKSQLHDMERTVSEVLSANDRVGSEEQYMHEIARLNTELAAKETQYEDSQRKLSMLNQDSQDLKSSLREAQAKATDAHREVDELREASAALTNELNIMRARVTDMSKAMAEPGTANNTRELRMLLQDVTRDNDKLKAQLRDMKKEMEDFLLSSRSPTQIDELKRENRRLKEQVNDLEVMVATVQSSTSSPSLFDSRPGLASRGSETMSRENDQLKQQLRDGQRAYADLRSNSETKLVELQQKIEALERDNNRLKQEARRNLPPADDRSVPPPAYDDSFVVSP